MNAPGRSGTFAQRTAEKQPRAWLWRGMVAVMALGIFTHPIGAFAQLDLNDPWPKFARDERNTTYCVPPSGAAPWVGRGPHSVPELRWWAELGLPDDSNHRGGAAVFKVDGVRYVAVASPARVPEVGGTPLGGKLRIFRFHPCDSNYDPAGGPALSVAERTFAGQVEGNEITMANALRATPQVLADDTIVVALSGQTDVADSGGVWAGDLSDLACPEDPEEPLEIPEVWSRGDIVVRGKTSPVVCPQGVEQTWAVMVAAQGLVFALDPATGATNWVSTVLIPNAAFEDESTPAVDPEAGTGGQVYVALRDGDGEDIRHFHVLAADDGDSPVEPLWSAFINRRYHDYCTPGRGSRFGIGTLGSPVVPSHGYGPVVGSDDGALYAFTNADTYNSSTNNQRWPLPECTDEEPFYGDLADLQYFVSSTPGVSPDGVLIFWDEDGNLHHFVDSGTSFARSQTRFELGPTWVFGAPVLDTASRVFVATPFSEDPEHSRIVRAYEYDLASFVGDDTGVWTYEPPTTQPWGETEVNLRRSCYSPLAMDEDGTLYVVNEGYLLALRPLRGDFDGDGCRNNFDVDPLVLALMNPASYAATFPAVNALGVGDCNNDGVLDNDDIDCFVDLVVNDPNCEGEGEGARGQNSEDWDHFWDTIAWLRGLYE